ncbi:hypothetical protein KY290_012951 [Solanum tuberosum]|uniref:Uncharacterized protein n=1 Tax=Solanum tuberosum TaxID=4113 RepID=A0ABQ7VKB6_SOLTU|nr:hypothetical protein KY285_012717 [Solanum tuberosum]KAH0768970.1 hypothetical protein KY290_012951 [Solanum tuberosum]
MDLPLIVDKNKILHFQIDSFEIFKLMKSRMSCSQGSALRGEFGMNSQIFVRASTWRLLMHTAMKVAELHIVGQRRLKWKSILEKEPTLESNELVVYIAYTLVK